MIDWLRRGIADPVVDIEGHALPIAVRRNARARRLTMRLAPDGSEVRVTLPRWCATREALAFVHARTDWLAEQLARVPPPRTVEPGGTVLLHGEELAVEWHPGHPRTPRRAGDSLQVGGPQESLSPRIRRWLEREALRVLADDLAHYAAKAGVALPQLRLSRAQRRWGSCSTGGIVRINWRLVQAPPAIRRSVVAHEIAHCLHFDHSPAFHAALARIFEGDIREADAWIKANGRSLYAGFG